MKFQKKKGEAFLFFLIVVVIVILLVALLAPVIQEAVGNPGYKKPLSEAVGHGWGHDPNLP